MMSKSQRYLDGDSGGTSGAEARVYALSTWYALRTPLDLATDATRGSHSLVSLPKPHTPPMFRWKTAVTIEQHDAPGRDRQPSPHHTLAMLYGQPGCKLLLGSPRIGPGLQSRQRFGPFCSAFVLQGLCAL